MRIETGIILIGSLPAAKIPGRPMLKSEIVESYAEQPDAA
jgi:hypothetical protein